MIKSFETDETPTSDVIKVGDKFTVDDYKKYISLHPEVPIYETEYVYLSFDFLKNLKVQCNYGTFISNKI